MKRLTEYTIPETGFSVVSEEKYKRIMIEEKPSVEKVYNRLKKIEDILGDEYDLNRLRELAQADREGRCVVLPKDGMVYYIEEAGGEKWIGNKPIQQVILRCGFGMALLEFSLFDKGKYFSRAEAEDALRREQDEQIKP